MSPQAQAMLWSSFYAGTGLCCLSMASACGVAMLLDKLNVEAGYGGNGTVSHRAKYACYACVAPGCMSYQLSRIAEAHTEANTQ